MAIDGAQLAVFVGPLVPDAHAMLLQVFYVGVALEEPEQFVDDRLQVQFLGGQQRETVLQVVARLRAEDADGACSGAVAFLRAFAQNAVKYV